MRALGEVKLRTGEILEIGVVEAPDDEYRDVVLGLLSHKRDAWQWHMEQGFDGKTGALRNLFYIGLIDGIAVCNIAVWQCGSTADLGHVYTVEEQRRKGICRAVMDLQMEDFRRQGGRFCVLGTGYDSPPYHIYKSYGFESMQPNSGAMYYMRDEQFWNDFLANGEVTCSSLAWEDWSDLCALMACPTADWYRSRRHCIFGPQCFEFSLLRDVQDFQEARHQARVLRGAGGVVGYGVLKSDDDWKGNTWLLDLNVHPEFTDQTRLLVEGFEWPDRKVSVWLEATSSVARALIELGFSEEARLTEMFMRNGIAQDVVVLSR